MQMSSFLFLLLYCTSDITPLNVHTEFDDNEDWDNWTGGYEEDKGPHCDDPNFNVIH